MSNTLVKKTSAKNRNPVVYRRMVEDIARRVHAGALAPGNRIPGENDLAVQYGISRSSVRLALNELAKQGLIVSRPGKGSFVQDPAAAEPRPHKVFSIGINPSCGDPKRVGWYDRKIMDRMLAVCDQRDARLGIYNGGQLHRLRPEYFDAAVLLFSNHAPDELLEVVDRGVPLVLFNRISEHEKIAYVSIPVRREAFEATRTLLARGHRRLGIVRIDFANQRHQGFEEAVAAHPGATAEACVVEAHRDDDHYAARVADFLRRPDRPRALFLPNGNLALAALNAMRILGLRAPEDVELMVFDDIAEMHSLYGQPFSYVKMPLAEMAADATGHLLEKLERPELPALKKLYKARIVDLAP